MKKTPVPYFFVFSFFLFCGTACAQVKKTAVDKLLADTNIAHAFIGIKVYNATDGKVLYAINEHRYFTPASNTKLLSLYAGLRFLGDSIPGMYFGEDEQNIYVRPAGDPSLLHPDFESQPALDFLKAAAKNIVADTAVFESKQYGPGWSWDDYTESFMNERSPLPVFGNNITFRGKKNSLTYFPRRPVALYGRNEATGHVKSVDRLMGQNVYSPVFDGTSDERVLVPFVTSQKLAFEILSDTLHRPVSFGRALAPSTKVLYSRPADSVFKPMMENSDNFFAEQTLLMVGRKQFGVFNTEKTIDSLLKDVYTFFPDKPNWADGSGLSRFNMFTPADFVALLLKMKADFNFERVKNILPTAGEGTLENYYAGLKNKIFAKTGTLSNMVCLSGYLITKKNKTLVFSVMVNDHLAKASQVRRAIEAFLMNVWETN